MENKDKQRFQKIINILAEDKAVKVSEGRMTILWEELKEFPIDQVEKAARRLMRSRRYAGFPSLADFVDLLEPDTSANAITAAKHAFDTLRIEGESHGYNGWKDPLVPIVIERMGGWINQAMEICRICCLDQSQIQEGIWRKNFETIYRAETQRSGPREVPKMIGTIKRDNEALGYLTDGIGNVIGRREDRVLTEGTEEKSASILVSMGSAKEDGR